VSAAADTTYASMPTGALEDSPSITAVEQEPTTQEKQLMLHLSNVSHGVNHFQNQMMAMLWPSIMEALGMSYYFQTVVMLHRFTKRLSHRHFCLANSP
jgi:hypothetical protein